MKYIKESILNAVRDSICIDQLLRAYLDETTDLLKEEKIKEVEKPPEPEKEENKKGLSFSDKDFAITVDNQLETIHAPKDEKTLEDLSTIRNNERKKMEALEEDEEEEKIKFSDDPISIPIETVPLDELPIQIDIEELK
jgi:hypothetical protein